MKADELDRYFARIGYRGAREATLPVLHALTAAHTQTIPFENLDVLLGRGIDLSDEAVFDKLVAQRRGGYCFEQNSLFLRVLSALGFEVTPLSARGRIIDRRREFTPPRTHVFLQVQLEGASWITDVGMGALSLTGALRFELGLEQATPHDRRRIIHEDGRYFHQVFHAEWIDVCEFTGEAMPAIDREISNWYTSAHPRSHFKDRLMVARAVADGRRYTVLNDELKIRERDGQSSVQAIATPRALLEILDERFGLKFPEGTRFGDYCASAR